MRLTSKGRYAVTAMLDVALNSEAGPVPLADISERQGISLSYLEQLFSRLRKNGLVSSVRGPGGGYLLGKDASSIAVGSPAAWPTIWVSTCMIARRRVMSRIRTPRFVRA
mgnify:CR=1 FL=1